MPSVRCPSCKRLLNLRDEMIGQEAKCPLCGAVFPAEPEGGRAVPYQPTPDVPDPARPWRPAGHRDEPSRLPSPPPRDGRPSGPVRRAGNWLFGLAVTSLVWNMTCGCGGVLAATGRLGSQDVDAFIVASAFLLQLVFEVVILAAGQAMRAGAKSRALCWTGVVLAMAEALFAFGRGLLMLAVLDKHPGGDLPVGFNCLAMLLSGALFCAGFHGQRVLSGPDGRPKGHDPFDD